MRLRLLKSELGEQEEVDESQSVSNENNNSISVRNKSMMDSSLLKHEVKKQPSLKLLDDIRDINIEDLDIPKHLKISLSNVKKQIHDFQKNHSQSSKNLPLREASALSVEFPA